MEDEFIKKLKEKYEKGEISREIYEDILHRYEEELVNGKISENTSNDEAQEKTGYDVKEGERSAENNVKEAVGITKSISGRDYKCAGSCALGPGTYGVISSAGSLKITGDVTADKITSAGSLFAEGNVDTGVFRSAGSAKIKGDLKGDNISVAGSIRVRNIQGDRIRVEGMLSCNNLKGDTITIEGGIKAGQVVGDKISIKIEGRGEIERIEGDEITIRSKRGFFRRCSRKLKANNIRGDKLYLECVIAENVEGDEVVVGENCDVGTLRAENMKIRKGSNVREVMKK